MHTASNAFVAKSCTSYIPDEEDDQYFEDDENELEAEYWSTDELGIDPEDLYEY